MFVAPLLAILLTGCEPTEPVIVDWCPEPQPKLADLDEYRIIDVALFQDTLNTAIPYNSWDPIELDGCETEGEDILYLPHLDTYLAGMNPADRPAVHTITEAEDGAWPIDVQYASAPDPVTVAAIGTWSTNIGLEHLSGSVTGAGSTVIVVDGGLPRQHPMFDMSKWHFGCFVSNACSNSGASSCKSAGSILDCGECKSPAECIHGAGMASAIAGVPPADPANLANMATRPIAPAALGWSLRVFQTELSTVPGVSDSDLLAALKDVLAGAAKGDFGPKAVMYLGFASSVEYAQANCSTTVIHPISKILSKIRAKGVRIVAPAGNNSQDSVISAPACFADVISVASSVRDDAHAAATWSNGQGTADLLAPGELYPSAGPIEVPDLNNPGQTVRSDYAWTLGTSMAAAQVTGALALLGERMDTAAWIGASDNALLACITGGKVDTNTKVGTLIGTCKQPAYGGRPALDIRELKP